MCSIELDCPICMESQDTVGCTLGSVDSCSHVCCFTCLKEWLDTCSACPICKKEVSFLYQHTLTVATLEAHALLAKNKQLDTGDADAFLNKHAPHSKAFRIEERQLPPEDPDPDSIPDVGHTDICEGARSH